MEKRYKKRSWDFRVFPRRLWKIKVVFGERVGWHNSMFVQVLPFCLWIYWNPVIWLREYYEEL